MERVGGDLDELLLLAAGRGDDAAWARYRERNLPIVTGYLLRRCDPAVVAELAAETFAAALLASGAYLPGTATPRSWLLAIAARTLRASRRRGRVERGARRQAALARVGGEEGQLAVGRAPVVLDPGTAIRHVVGELRRCQRDALSARVVEELDWHEVATELQRSEPEARACFHCALDALRGQLLATR
jgi:RNA polymerase sigma-70 factor (ECF subfamily)